MENRHVPADLHVTAICAALMVMTAGSLHAQAPSKADVLARVATYLAGFATRAANVVADETYTQLAADDHTRRTMRADVAFVQLPDVPTWLALRDVYEVDGQPVPGWRRHAWMGQLFLAPPDDAVRMAREIARKSARYNLSDIGTLNNPFIALRFLQGDYQPRLRFTLAGIDQRLGSTVRRLRFEEIQRPTVLRGPTNRDLPAEGLAWVDERNGRILKTELHVGAAREPNRIETMYRLDERLGVAMPVELRDWYPDVRGLVSGKATYGEFRPFHPEDEERQP